MALVRTLGVATVIMLVAAACNLRATSSSVEPLRQGADSVDIDATYTVEQTEPDNEARPRKMLVAVEYRVVAPLAGGTAPNGTEPVDTACFASLTDPGATSRPETRQLVLSSSASALTLREEARIDLVPASCSIPVLFDLQICDGCSGNVDIYVRIVTDDCSAYLGNVLVGPCSSDVERGAWMLAGTTSAIAA